MEKEYFAHIDDAGNTQTVAEHLDGVADLCEKFADSFGAGQQGQLIGLAHDIGKYTHEFQKRLHGGHIVDHATAGALECAKQNALWAACCVAGHHGGLPDVGNRRNDNVDTPTLYGRLRRLKRDLDKGIRVVEVEQSLPRVPPPPGYGRDTLTDSFVIRMLYSCLVDADFLDTERFMSGGTVERGGGESIAVLLDKLNHYISPWWNPTKGLNRLRCQILRSCIDHGGDKAFEKGVYSLTVPTGGGKTIASMAFALNHAATHHMDRVIYVIPYTSIIEQTAAVFRDVFGENNVVEHHTNAVFDVKEGVKEEDNAAQYRQIRATENWDAPIIVTTAVQFFESLYANRSSKCRKLHSIANSVIIFDEAQMLPAAHLRPCVAGIAKLVECFGATAVLCTATQPVLNDLFAKYVPGVDVRELCPDMKTMFTYFRRVTFRHIGTISPEGLAERLSALPQVLCIVNSRKAAQEVFAKLPRNGSYHLSTLMYPAHRRAVLEEIRQRLKDGLPCRVVSTSLIEAGVDVDFPAVFREMAGLDSILQAAGRCNREGKRSPEESIVTVFTGVAKTPKLLQVNIGAAEEALDGGADPANPETVARYFRAFRSLAPKELDQVGVVESFEKGVQGCTLPFRTVAEQFHLIDDATKTVYIPLDKGAEPIRRLQEGERSRDLYRRAGQFAVNVYAWQYQELLACGTVQSLDDEGAVLLDTSLYQKETGLTVSEGQGVGHFC